VKNSFIHFNGKAEDPTKFWKDEQNFLILGISLEKSIEIGNLFKQNALIWCELGHAPKLILLR
tara:strand:+ start:1351 stop:1539 length:189 start_codon:yes stop_codon:yes gene_type:complete